MNARRPRRRPGENRARLLEAGLIEFGLFGFHAASTSAIAARADVPQPHLYASFATKRELFLACVEAAIAQRPAEAGSDASVTQDPPAAFAPAERPSENAIGLMLFQATAALRDPSLVPALGALLEHAREAWGSDRYEALLLLAARELAAS